MDRRVGLNRTVRAAAVVGLLALASEFGVSKPADALAQPNPDSPHSLNTNGLKDYFGALSGDVRALPPRLWQCLTELGIKWHDRRGDGSGDLKDAEVTVFNTSNPDKRVTLKPESSIPYDPNGYARYDRNTRNPGTGENFALLEGNRACQAECQTEIGLYESKEGQPIGPITRELVDCPSSTRCVTNLHWRDEGQRFRLTVVFPTATASEVRLEPTPTAVATATSTPDSSFVQRPK